MNLSSMRLYVYSRKIIKFSFQNFSQKNSMKLAGIYYLFLLFANLLSTLSQEEIDTSELVQMIQNMQQNEHRDHAHIRIVQSGGSVVSKLYIFFLFL